MYEVERKFKPAKNSPPCKGRYIYRVTYNSGGLLVMNPAVSEWLEQDEYFAWKREIIKELFPTCEA